MRNAMCPSPVIIRLTPLQEFCQLCYHSTFFIVERARELSRKDALESQRDGDEDATATRVGRPVYCDGDQTDGEKTRRGSDQKDDAGNRRLKDGQSRLSTSTISVIVITRKHLKSALVNINIFSPGMAVESEIECQMDTSVEIYVRESKCQLSSSKTSEQEN